MGPEPAFQFPDINTKVKQLTGEFQNLRYKLNRNKFIYIDDNYIIK